MRFLIFFVITFCFFNPAVAGNNLCEAHHCVGVVDVGSTGTRLFLYSYDFNDLGYPIHIQEEWSKKITPGLAMLDTKQENIDAYLDTLFSTQMNSKIPVYFYATAGMRLFSDTKQKQYYHAVEDWFSRSSSWTLLDAKTITGKEEGVYAWLALNYKVNAFEHGTAENIGVMDMGGASVQVVFPIQKPVTLPGSHVAEVDVYGKKYTLYAYSALGLGQTLVTQQFLNHSSCYPSGYPLADKDVAQGDVLSCVKDIVHLVNDVHHVAREVQPILRSNEKNWYVMGGLVYLAQRMSFDTSLSLMPDSLLHTIDQKVCSRSWPDFSSQYSAAEEGDCLAGSYYYALMVDGYGLSSGESLNLVQDEGWTLGVVLSLSPN